jgi:hypothetical protein
MKYLLVFLLSFNCLAQVQHITKGTPAPYDGHLFTEKKAREVRKELLEKDKLEVFTKALLENEKRHKKIISNQNEQIEILKDHTMKLADMAQMSTGEKIFWFSLGVAATSFAVYGAAQLVNK